LSNENGHHDYELHTGRYIYMAPAMPYFKQVSTFIQSCMLN